MNINKKQLGIGVIIYILILFIGGLGIINSIPQDTIIKIHLLSFLVGGIQLIAIISIFRAFKEKELWKNILYTILVYCGIKIILLGIVTILTSFSWSISL